MVDYVDSLIQHYEMGKAYKHITATKLPAPQLIAFLCSDEIARGDVSLESLDIEQLHQKLLSEINLESNEELVNILIDKHKTSEHSSAQESLNETEVALLTVEDVLRERDMASTYIRITEEMGPCQQLIDFVNYSGSMTSDEGVALESMNMFDQHNLILSKLDPGALDAIATESLKDTIVKYRKWLIVGGFFVPFVGLPMLLAGITGVVMNKKMQGEVPTVKEFTALTKIFDTALKQDTLFTSAIPSNADAKAWEKLDIEGFQKTLDDLQSDRHSVDSKPADIGSSGWTAESYVNAVKWLKANKEKAEAADKTRSQKLSGVETAIGSGGDKDASATRYVSSAISQASKMSRFTLGVFDDIGHLLLKVSHHFEPTKKDD